MALQDLYFPGSRYILIELATGKLILEVSVGPTAVYSTTFMMNYCVYKLVLSLKLYKALL